MPMDSAASFREGKALFDNRHYDGAIDKFRQALDGDPSCSGAHHYLGRSFLEKQLQDLAAREFAEAIRHDPTDGNSRYWLAGILLDTGNSADAFVLLYEAIRLKPGLLHHFCARIAGQIGKSVPFREAETFFRNSIAILESLAPETKAVPEVTLSRASLHAALGSLYFSRGLLNGAMLQYREAAAISPREPVFHARLADIYFITNNSDEAIAEYRAALVQEPGNAGIRKRLGDALVKTRRFVDAFSEYREAARLAPEDEFYRKVLSQFRTLFMDCTREGAGETLMRKPPVLHGATPSIADETFGTLIRGGENEFVEFKSRALWSKSLSRKEIDASESRDVHKFGKDTSKVIIARTIAGFLNTDGGNLVIGIRENKGGVPNEILGIEGEFPLLRDPCTDGYRRMLIDEIIRKYLPPEIYHRLNNNLRIHFMKVEDHILCWLEIRKADDAVFITVQDDEFFFIRIDAETRQLSDKALVDYVRKRFP